MSNYQSNDRFILVLTNETDKTLIPIKENMIHGKKIKGDFLLPIPGKTRREYHFSNTSDDTYYKLIEAQLSLMIPEAKSKQNTEFMLTIKLSLGEREIITYYQPLPLECERSKALFNSEFEFTSGCRRERSTNILYISIREKHGGRI